MKNFEYYHQVIEKCSTKFKNTKCNKSIEDMVKRKTKTTKNARSFIQRHVKTHIEDGMEQKRAVAAAYSEARRKGYSVPRSKKK